MLKLALSLGYWIARQCKPCGNPSMSKSSVLAEWHCRHTWEECSKRVSFLGLEKDTVRGNMIKVCKTRTAVKRNPLPLLELRPRQSGGGTGLKIGKGWLRQQAVGWWKPMPCIGVGDARWVCRLKETLSKFLKENF